MEIELNDRQRQVLGLEELRRNRGYKEGWLYHLCRQKSLLPELQALQLAGLVGDARANGSSHADGYNYSVDPGQSRETRTLLTVELVPSSCWFSNLRSELSKEEWDRLRRLVYKQADSRCEVCGARGTQHPVECHEVWQYDDVNHIQHLLGLVALCPACHESKHMGYAASVGKGGQARAHLARVNGWSMEDVELYLEVEFEQWGRRSQHEWSLDVSWLQQFGISINPERIDKRH